MDTVLLPATARRSTEGHPNHGFYKGRHRCVSSAMSLVLGVLTRSHWRALKSIRIVDNSEFMRQANEFREINLPWIRMQDSLLQNREEKRLMLGAEDYA